MPTLSKRSLALMSSSLKVKDVMTKKVITGSEEITLDEAKQVLHKHNYF
jgi:CBS-domain-containing membrane protein